MCCWHLESTRIGSIYMAKAGRRLLIGLLSMSLELATSVNSVNSTLMHAVRSCTMTAGTWTDVSLGGGRLKLPQTQLPPKRNSVRRSYSIYAILQTCTSDVSQRTARWSNSHFPPLDNFYAVYHNQLLLCLHQLRLAKGIMFLTGLFVCPFVRPFVRPLYIL